MINKKKEDDDNESVCDNCKPVSGFYLGMTCPKCGKPFRSVIDKRKINSYN